MKLWLIYREADVKKNDWYIQQYISEGKSLGLDIQLVLTSEFTFGLNPKPYVMVNGQETELPDAAIVRTIDFRLNHQLTMLGIKTFNNETVSRICNDKASTYQEISCLGIPMVPTVICKRDCLMAKVKEAKLPLVVKTVDGHGGQEVFLLDEETETLQHKVQEILDKTISDFVIQPLFGTRHQDLRVYVLGKKILASILRTSKEGFRSNFSLGGSVCTYELNQKEQEQVNKIINHFDFDLVGIDFIIGDDGTLVFNEIEDVVGARMLYQCTDINLVGEYLKYIKTVLQ